MATNLDPLTKLKKARLSLLLYNPFFGNLVMTFPLQESSSWCPTMAVDGKNIYYNEDFVNSLTLDETVFVFCHEILHCVFQHLGRRGHRDPQYFNMAGDYVINALLIQENIGAMPTKPVQDKGADGTTSQRVGLYDKRYAGWTTEAVYDDLVKRAVKKQMTLDVHLELGKDAQSKDGKGQMRGIPIEIGEDDLKQIEQELKDKILQSAQAAAGKMPAGISRLIDTMVEPKINWRDYLVQAIQSQLTADYAWHRPNRRHASSDIIFPTLMREETIDIEVSIDMSGSISQEMARDCISEVYGITQQYHDFSVGVSTFDTKVYNRQVFTGDNVDDMINYEFKGGGGTDIAAVARYLKSHDIQPKLLLIFTDLECSDHGPADFCETIFLINNPWDKDIKPQHGTYLRYEPKSGVIEEGSVT
jgi:predicted metal-dependent peptidase